MKTKWMIKAKRADFTAIGKQFGISPVTARLIVNRGVTGEDAIRKYLYGDARDFYDPRLMPDLTKAGGMILDVIAGGRRIAIVSDYDVDGVMSGYILRRAFRRLGGNCRIYTPERIRDGYGLNVRITEEAFADGASMIVTCDNGTTAFEGIARAKALGMQVIVTDHHELAFEELPDGSLRERLPEADAVVNPCRKDSRYPFRGLCGAGVAFKLITYLYRKKDIPQEELYELLEYTAMATVADVMDLTDENRILVRLGLKRAEHTQNVGLRALIRESGLQGKRLTAYHVGFVLGPCFNAAGRLETAKTAFELLEETDESEAVKKAAALKALNDSRKDMTADGYCQALDLIDQEGLTEDRVLVVLLPDTHESLVGIIAGRIKEKFHRPTIVFTRVGEGMVKGSGRSIEAYDMFRELSRQQHLLTRFGGHPMAAGLTLPEAQLGTLRENLNRETTLTDDDLVPVVHIDVAMPLRYATSEQIHELSLLEPFGKGNDKPVFAQRSFRILSARVLGKNANVLRMKIEDAYGTAADAVYFGDIPDFITFLDEEFGAEQRERVFSSRPNQVELAMTYYPEINEYRGHTSVQIVIREYCRMSQGG